MNTLPGACATATASLVIRFQTRPEMGGALHRHITGETRPETAEPRPNLPAVVVYEDNLAAGREAVTQAAMPARGRRPAPIVDFIVAGPPPIDGVNAWARDRVEEWAEAAIVAVKTGLGARSAVTAAALHLDERSPHVHVQAVPVDDRGRLGWAHVRAQWAGLPPTPKGQRRSKAEAATAAARILDRVHEVAGAPFGLERGEAGGRRRHRAVDRVKGARDRAADVLRKARARILWMRDAAAADRERVMRDARAKAAAVLRRARAGRSRMRAQERKMSATVATWHRVQQAVLVAIDQEATRSWGNIQEAREAQAEAEQAGQAAVKRREEAEQGREVAEAATRDLETRQAGLDVDVAALGAEHRRLDQECERLRSELRKAQEEEKPELEAELAELRQQAKAAREAKEAAEARRAEAVKRGDRAERDLASAQTGAKAAQERERGARARAVGVLRRVRRRRDRMTVRASVVRRRSRGTIRRAWRHRGRLRVAQREAEGAAQAAVKRQEDAKRDTATLEARQAEAERLERQANAEREAAQTGAEEARARQARLGVGVDAAQQQLAELSEQHRALERDCNRLRGEVHRAREEEKLKLEEELRNLRQQAKAAREAKEAAEQDAQAAVERLEEEYEMLDQRNYRLKAAGVEDARKHAKIERALWTLDTKFQADLQREEARVLVSFSPSAGDELQRFTRLEVGHYLGALAAHIPDGIPGATESGSPGQQFMEVLDSLKTKGKLPDVRGVLVQAVEQVVREEEKGRAEFDSMSGGAGGGSALPRCGAPAPCVASRWRWGSKARRHPALRGRSPLTPAERLLVESEEAWILGHEEALEGVLAPEEGLNPAPPGECLRESVRAMGWTVTEAARHLGLSRVMTSRLLCAQARLSAAYGAGN